MSDRVRSIKARKHRVLNVNVEHVHTGAYEPAFAPTAILRAQQKVADEESIEPKRFGE